MPRHQSQPAMVPYRDNGTIKYAPDPNALHGTGTGYDDDFAPLITNAVYVNEDEDDDALQRFTATGRPMPVYKPSVYARMNPYAAPQHLPQRYTDESIIPVVVLIPHPSPEKRRRSFMDKFKIAKSSVVTKVVFMPRGDYLKYFAKDYDGRYIGTEPQKEWTEQELGEKFGMYRKDLRAKRANKANKAKQ